MSCPARLVKIVEVCTKGKMYILCQFSSSQFDSSDNGCNFRTHPRFTKFKAMREFYQFHHVTIGKIGTTTIEIIHFMNLLITQLAKYLHVAVHWQIQIS